MAFRLGHIFAVGLALLAAGCTLAPASLLDEFETTLAGDHSATEALRQWCARQDIADPPVMTARPIPGQAMAADSGILKWLDIPANEQLGYRHVALSCGNVVLSEAHNWYVPGRLPDAMNLALETSQTPFGKVVSPLGFTRERLDARRGAASNCPSGTILSHRAILKLPDGKPISLVVECYTVANLGR